MDGNHHIQILEDELMLSTEHLGKTPSQRTFQQDSHPKHTCKKARDCFKNTGMVVLPWPESPDLNPIEHLWQHLRKFGECPEPPKDILELWESVEQEQEAILASFCKDLMESMPRRVAAVTRAKGAAQSTNNPM